MPALQYSLRTFVGFFLGVCLLIGLIAAFGENETVRAVLFFVACRAFALIIGSIPAEFFAASRTTIMALLVVGFTIADLVWMGFLLLIGESIDSVALSYNPLLIIPPFTCAAACLKGRKKAFVAGLFLSTLLPAIGAALEIMDLASGPKTEGAEVVGMLISMLAVFAMATGVVTTVVMRFVFELIQYDGRKAGRS